MMAPVQVEPVYRSVCANRHENTIECYQDHLLYSRCNTLVIYNLKTKEAPTLLFGHVAEVNGQCFVVEETAKDTNEAHIISTSYDKSAIIWKIRRDGSTIDYNILYTLKFEGDDVFVTRSSILVEDNFFSITTTLEGLVQLWKNDTLLETRKEKYCCFQSKIYSIKLDGCDLASRESLNFVFLAGGDNRVHVFQLTTKLVHLFDLEGHTDWIKCLDVLDLSGRHLECLLASSSQDSYVRIWHLKLVNYKIDSKQIRTTESIVLASQSTQNYRLTATLETVLSGHEGIAHGLCWFRQLPQPTVQLITCSADKTIVIWKSSVAPSTTTEHQRLNKYEQCPATGEIWKETHRFGETGETNLPFLGVCVSQEEQTFFAHSLHGAIHSWSLEHNKWVAKPSITGHFGPVTDLVWEKSGAYLLSSSLDKTCRMHAIARDDENRWHEITRPQVHGHEINCLVSLDFTKFATGAEEKTIRTFEATQFFMKNFKALTKCGLPKEIESTDIEQLPMHAQLPALGLSNKGASSPYDVGDPTEKNSSTQQWYGVSKLVEQLAQIDHLDSLPTEEILLQSTLWWETNKLFGHGNELHALAVDSLGTYLASASKANKQDLANILVWDCSKFRKVATIEHHTLTVTRLKFSPNDRYLLSVSRDRTWCLSERTGQLRQAYRLLVGTSKNNAVHSRIIWDCCWTPDSQYFITVSRDKKAIVWSLGEVIKWSELGGGGELELGKVVQSEMLFNSSIQAIDCADCRMISTTGASGASNYLLALGFEDGSLELHTIEAINGVDERFKWIRLMVLANFHQLPIRRLTFRPTTSAEWSPTKPCHSIMLASAGDDSIVNLTRFVLQLHHSRQTCSAPLPTPISNSTN